MPLIPRCSLGACEISVNLKILTWQILSSSSGNPVPCLSLNLRKNEFIMSSKIHNLYGLHFLKVPISLSLFISQREKEIDSIHMDFSSCHQIFVIISFEVFWRSWKAQPKQEILLLSVIFNSTRLSENIIFLSSNFLLLFYLFLSFIFLKSQFLVNSHCCLSLFSDFYFILSYLFLFYISDSFF